MDLKQFDRLCKNLPATTMVVQWGEAHVYKLGGKMFVMGNEWEGQTAFILKTSPLTYEILLQQGIATRAPYLTRGNWVQISNPTTLTDADLAEYIRGSYDIIAGKLTNATKAGLGLG